MGEEEQNRALTGTLALGSILSALSVTFLIVSALALGKWHKSYWRVILALALCDLTAACSFASGAMPMFLWREPLSPIQCNLQATIIQLAGIGAVYYPLAIAGVLYLVVVRKLKLSSHNEVAIHIMWLPLALVTSLLPLYGVGGIGNGDSAGWCWVKREPQYARFVLFYVWTWGIMLTIVFLYCRIVLAIKREAVRTPRLTEIATGYVFRSQSACAKRLVLYPLAFIVFWVPATINRTLEAFDATLYAFTYIEVFFIPAQGIVNTGIYLYTSGAHKELLRMLRRSSSSDIPYESQSTSETSVESSRAHLSQPSMDSSRWL